MVDLEPVKAALQAVPGIAQVVLPDMADAQQVDTRQVMTSLLRGVLGANVYQVRIPAHTGYPAAAYGMAGLNLVLIDGYPVLRDDAFDIEIHGPNGAAVVAAARSLIDAFAGYSPAGECGAVTLQDESDDYNDDLGTHQVLLSVQMTHLDRADQALPAVFVYTVEDQSDGTDLFDGAHLNITSFFGVVLVAKIPAGGISALNALHDAMLNAVVRQFGESWTTVQWGGGAVNEVHNGFVVWRDTFSAKTGKSFVSQ